MSTNRKSFRRRTANPLPRTLRLELLESRWLLSVDPAWFGVLNSLNKSSLVIAGDYNGDLLVNGDDYTVWRSSFGQTGLVSSSGADGNGDGVIDTADYVIWRNNVGASAPLVTIPIDGVVARAVANEWLVTLDADARSQVGSPADVPSQFPALAANNITVLGGTGIAGQLLIRTPVSDPASVKTLLDSLMLFETSYYPNLILGASKTPNDSRFSDLWGLNNTGQRGGTTDNDIDAPEAWDLSTGSDSVMVAVIDSGIDYNHVDLAANIWTNPGEIPANGIDDDGNGLKDDVHGYDFVNEDGDPIDDDGHGTHVAGTIAAVGNNGTGISGVAWNATLIAMKILDANGNGEYYSAARAISYATTLRQRGVNLRITNNSYGGPGADPYLTAAMILSRNAGILNIAAAGNEGQNNDVIPAFPASYPFDNVISVAATDDDDKLASFSNYGQVAVDLAAPGVDILSTIPGNSYMFYPGTSMASPHVAGVAALAWSFAPNATYQQVRDAILNSVDVLPQLNGKVATSGRLNAFKTLASLVPPKLDIAPINAVRNEGNTGSSPATSFTFRVTRSNNTSGTTTVAYSVTGLGPNPANGSDFDGGTLPSGSLTFNPTETTKDVIVQVFGDTTFESDEGFRIMLSNASAPAMIVNAIADGTILNDDLRPTLAIAPLDAVKSEGDSGSSPGTAFTFRVTRSGDTSGMTTVNYAVTGSGPSPASGTDFVGGILPSGDVSFSPTETMKDISIQVFGDTVAESDEGFTVTLSNPSPPAEIGTSTATGTILDDDVPGVTIIQSGGGTNVSESGPTTDTYTIELNTVPTASVQITVTADAQTRVSVDGVNFFASVNFNRTTTIRQMITVRAVDDTVAEGPHTSTVSHAITSSTDPNYPLSMPIPSVIANVADNDQISLAISALDAVKPEGNSGTSPATAFTFRVTRSGDTSGTTTVNYAVSGSGANPANAADFMGNVLPSGTVTFNSNDTFKDISIQVIGDTAVEPNEGFTVTLSNPFAPAVIGTSSATGTIQNDDPPPQPPLEFVTIGNPGNLSDPEVMTDGTTGYGAVAYTFQIGMYEVTAGQYTEFLNAVAKTDTHGLYNPLMDSNDGSLGANIKRSGSGSGSDPFVYSVAADWAERPVNQVSLWDAARFANWLHNGRPIGLQGPGTTENGAYHDIGNASLFGRNPGARFFIPTENEWYKAAYHKNDGTTANYWDYPTGSDTPPINTLPDTGPNKHANFYDQFNTGNSGYTIGSPYYRTEVGQFNNSPSPYGTFDQGGNVWEWNENGYPSGSGHAVRGGSLSNWSNSLVAGNSWAGGSDPSVESGTYGFRVAAAVGQSAAAGAGDFTVSTGSSLNGLAMEPLALSSPTRRPPFPIANFDVGLANSHPQRIARSLLAIDTALAAYVSNDTTVNDRSPYAWLLTGHGTSAASSPFESLEAEFDFDSIVTSLAL